jgi:hypothetical protein
VLPPDRVVRRPGREPVDQPSHRSARGTLQLGEIGMLRREEYLIQYEALADQDSWRHRVREAD